MPTELSVPQVYILLYSRRLRFSRLTTRLAVRADRRPDLPAQQASSGLVAPQPRAEAERRCAAAHQADDQQAEPGELRHGGI